MVFVSYNELKELAGPVSVFTFVIGATAGALSYWCSVGLKSWPTHTGALRFVSMLPVLMGIFAVFLHLVAGLSLAFSGPEEKRALYGLSRFDRLFAAEIAFAFAFVFSFDCLRIKVLRKKATTWIVIAVYSTIAACLFASD
jgi:hypothetical protein